MRKQKGFSLIELLIVVAIILIIAAIAIPNLLKSRIAANESSAVAAVRTLATSEITYGVTNNGNYTDLAGLGTVGLIDNLLSTGVKSGYSFTAAAGSTAGTFTVGASPQTANTTGVRQFCAVTDGVVRVGASASCGSNPALN